MRLFVALNLPEQEKEALYEAIAPLREAGLPVRWIEPAALHVTLKFLGWVRPEDVEGIAETMRQAAAKTRPFELSVGGLGAFPTRRRPRVLWAGAEATSSLRCLKHDLEWSFAAHGFERETRAFQPHITLGRATREAGAGDFREIETLFGRIDHRAVVRADEIDLMRSHLSAAGARYERIASAPLG